MEDGDYLWQCLCYIELNMVRCGVVAHPRDWAWVGYHEIMGIAHREFPLFGVQFHPESFLTHSGYDILRAFLAA